MPAPPLYSCSLPLPSRGSQPGAREVPAPRCYSYTGHRASDPPAIAAGRSHTLAVLLPCCGEPVREKSVIQRSATLPGMLTAPPGAPRWLNGIIVNSSTPRRTCG
ncbi:hypothetical protein E2C01_013164 [Portunus trituberculatus]|uniref:Uncharacterized protein n=1 Tax=Portunus trituberculatus TaxID=210409 RepID=A0A5B7DGC8_PORTR|nr:hypothetical protein [Portunus trituberculatus]